MHPLSETNPASAALQALKDPSNRSMEIGIACTILFHLLLLFLAPQFPVETLHGSAIGVDGMAASKGHEFDIELSPDEFAAPVPKPEPFKFIETNPEAPENEPDKTDNFSNRNQQLGQPEPATENAENMPRVEGRDDIQSDAIVSGMRATPEAGAPVTVMNIQTPSNAAEQQQTRAEQVPLTGFDKVDGESEDGVGTNISEAKTPTTNADELVEGVRDATNATGGLVVTTDSAEQMPRPRQRVQLSQARPNVLQNRSIGTDRISPRVAAPAFRNEFGDYLQEIIEIVDTQWRVILGESRTAPPPNTHVTITFVLSSEGLTRITSVEHTSGRPGVYAAQSAIEDRQPYRKWSDKMIAVLGKEQTLTFTFYY